MAPLLTWVDVASVLRMDKPANTTEADERMRKRRILRIMREAGGVDLGRSNWRVSEEQIQRWLARNATVYTSAVGTGGHHATR